MIKVWPWLNYKSAYEQAIKDYAELAEKYTQATRERADLTRQIEKNKNDINAQAQRIVDLLAENGDLHKQLNTAQSNLEVFAYRIKELERDRDGFKLRLDGALNANGTLLAENAALKQPVEATAPKPKRTSRAKPPAQEEEKS